MPVRDNLGSIGGGGKVAKNVYSQISPTDITNTTFTQSNISNGALHKSNADFTVDATEGEKWGSGTFTSDDYFEINFDKSTYCIISVANNTGSNSTYAVKGTMSLIDESGTVTELAAYSSWTTTNGATITTIRDITALGLPSGRYKLQLALNSGGPASTGSPKLVSRLTFIGYGIMFV